MLDFLFPWSMAAGGVLISSPILIHLINRMRFKRDALGCDGVFAEIAKGATAASSSSSN